MATVTSTVETTAVVADPLRIPPVAADLLPVEVFQSRRDKTVRRLVILMMVGFALLLTAWYGVEYVRTELQQADLVAAEDSVRDLKSRQHKFDPLVKIQSETRSIETQLGALMANDLQWATLVSSLRQAQPDGVVLTGVTAAVAIDGAAAGGGQQLPGNPAARTIGTLTINGKGETKELVARYVDALAKLAGLANPFLVSAVEADGVVGFSIRIDITSVALDGRYKPTAAPKAGE